MSANSFLYIAGPCVIEDEEQAFTIARGLKEITAAFDVDFVFKASFDKANRTSVDSFRGPGLEEGLRILAHIKQELGLRVTSDVHEVGQVEPAAEVLDIIQIPAFLCRQTDLLVAAGNSRRTVNIKKGQFVAPEDMEHAVKKIESTGHTDILLTERGSTFGYHNLVVDFRSFSIMRASGYPIIFDATHSVQVPSAGAVSGGRSEFIAPLSRAAAAYGIDGLFTEVHPNPEAALSDGPNSLNLESVAPLLETVLRIRAAADGGGGA